MTDPKKPKRTEKAPETDSGSFLQNYLHLFMQMGRTIGTSENNNKLDQRRFDEVLKTSLDTLVTAGVLSQETARTMTESIEKNPQFFRTAFSIQMDEWQEKGVLTHTGFNSDLAARIARSDNAGGGYCARGTRNILTAMGYVSPRGDAHTWDEQMARSPHWVRLSGVTPQTAPEGAVLFYDRTSANAKGGGARYGHVEVVVDGGYASDKVRSNYGGTVKGNFEGAYIYVGPNAPAENLQLARAQQEGSRMRGIREEAPNLALT